MSMLVEKLFGLIEAVCKKEKEKDAKKVVVGKNKSRITVHPVVKEGVNPKEFTAADRVRAVTNPEGVLADENASPELKSYAHSIRQLRLGNL